MRQPAITALVLALLTGTTAAFALTQRLKLERSPVAAPRFDRRLAPTCRCRDATARLSLKLRRAERVDAAMVDGDGEVVRVLARDLERPKGAVTFRWDGRDDAGDVVRDGSYRLRIDFERQGRTIVVPVPVEVDTKRPAVTLVAIRPSTLSPDGDGRNDRATIVYRAREPIRLLVFVDGRLRTRTRVLPPEKTRFRWFARAGRTALRAGVHAVSLRVRDLAGNVSRPTEAVSVRIRYIELAQKRMRARRGGTVRFRVLTDARPFTWSIRRRRGPVVVRRSATAPLVTARLPGSVRSGRYALLVSANGHSDRGVLTVVRG